MSTNNTWTASSSANWLTLSTTSGSNGNNQTLSYTISENTSEQSRTANITITAGTKTQKVQVMQDGNPPIVDEFLSRWYATNLGTQPYGDLYRWDQLPSCPSGFHVPSKAEFEQLCTYPNVWGTGPGGVNGRWFCPTNAAKSNPTTASGCVFFPAAGYGYVSDGRVGADSQGTDGCYWSSTPNASDPDCAYGLYFTRDNANVYWNNWRYTTSDGVTWWNELSVRCIKD